MRKYEDYKNFSSDSLECENESCSHNMDGYCLKNLNSMEDVENCNIFRKYKKLQKTYNNFIEN